MPSFDVVSEVDLQEVRNAVDQAARELGQRFDFKGTNTSVVLGDDGIAVESSTDDRLAAARQVVEEKLVKRKVSLKAIGFGDPTEIGGGRVKLVGSVNAGIDQDKGKAIGKYLKERGLKGVSHQIQGDHLRVTGKKKDLLQDAIAALKEHDFGIPLQFKNFRD